MVEIFDHSPKGQDKPLQLFDESAKTEALALYERQKTLFEQGKVPGQDPNHMLKAAQY
jgi:hypothetical protein